MRGLPPSPVTPTIILDLLLVVAGAVTVIALWVPTSSAWIQQLGQRPY